MFPIYAVVEGTERLAQFCGGNLAIGTAHGLQTRQISAEREARCVLFPAVRALHIPVAKEVYDANVVIIKGFPKLLLHG